MLNAVTGELRDYESTADSGSKTHRKFCPVCGTQLFSQAESRPHLVFARPSSTIWTASAPSWACIDRNLPQLPGQPPPIA